jgi:hypothetical protein
MTTSKSNKTMLGMPADLQAVLQKLKEEEAARNGQKPLLANAAPAAPSVQVAPSAPIVADAALHGAGSQGAHGAHGTGGLAASNLLRTQYGNPHGGFEVDDSRYTAPVLPDSGQFTFPPPSAAGSHEPVAASPRVAASLNRTLIGMSPTDIAAAQAAVAAHMARANAPSAQPPELRSRQSTGDVAVAARPVMVGGEPGTAAEFAQAQAPQLALSAEDAAHPRAGADGASRDPIGGNTTAADRPRLSLPRDEPAGVARAPKPRSNAPKRWPALALLGLAVVVGAGAIVARAPQLLPGPLAALFGAGGAQQSPVAEVPAPVRAEQETSAAAATREVPKAAPPAPVRAAVIVATSSAPGAPLKVGSAELERQAIDLLVENDYAGAAKLYERLRTAEPSRPEYGVMLEVLARQASGCGQPGQEPCAAQ